MRILMIATDFPYLSKEGVRMQGGGPACVAQLAQALHEQGKDVAVVTRGEGGEKEGYGFPIFRTFYLNLGFRDSKITHSFWAALKALSLANKFDIIHSHNPSAGIAGVVTSKLKKKPHILTMHGPWAGVRQNRFVRWAAELIEGWVGRNSDFVTCDSAELVEIMRRYGIPPNKLRYIPNAVDVGIFKRINGKEAREKLGIRSDEPLVLYTGRFVEEKGLPYLLEAAAEILEKRKVLFFLVGGGFDEKIVKDWLVRNHQFKNRILVKPFVEYETMPFLYNASDVFVLPSFAEGMSRAVLEAMACEIPVVGTGVGGNLQLLKEGRGILVPIKNSGKIADALEKLLASKKLRGEMGKKSRAFVKKNMSVRVRVGAFMEVYKKFRK